MVVHYVDFGIIAALPVERNAILAQLESYTQLSYDEFDARTYYRGSVKTKLDQQYTVVVTLLPDMGNIESTMAAIDLIRLWKPRYILMVGIAGGAHPDEQEYGDILVSKGIYYYELQKLKDGKAQQSPVIFHSDKLLLDRAMANAPDLIEFARTDSFNLGLRIPKVHYGHLASGEKVVADTKIIRDVLLTSHRKIVGVEMESAGIASVVERLGETGFLSIRGVSDFADAAKTDFYHEYAARNAAKWAYEFLVQNPVAHVELMDLPDLASRTSNESAKDRWVRFKCSTTEIVSARETVTEYVLANIVNKNAIEFLCSVLSIDKSALMGKSTNDKVDLIMSSFTSGRQLIGLVNFLDEGGAISTEAG